MSEFKHHYGFLKNVVIEYYKGKPTSFSNYAPAYRVAVLLNKEFDKDLLNELKTIIKGVKTDKWGDPNIKTKQLLKDCDVPKANGKYYPPEFAGCYILNASTKKPPVCVDKEGSTLTPLDFVSGMCCDVQLDFYGYEYNDDKGIGVQLIGLKKNDKSDREHL